MPVEVGSNQITGITTTVNSTDAASKQYVDSYASSSVIPSITGNENKFLYTNGSSLSWQSIGASQEYTSAGTYTFNIPPQATKFMLDLTGAGGGGASGDFVASNYPSATLWRLRTAGTLNQINAVGYKAPLYSLGGAASPPVYWTLRTAGSLLQVNASTYISNSLAYLLGGASGLLNYSTNSINWSLRTAGTLGSINALGVYSGSYIAGGVGLSRVWTLRTTPFAANAIYTSMYDGTNYWIGGAAGFLATSTDSINWVLRTSGTTAQIGYTAGGSGLLYASGQTNAYVSCGYINSTITLRSSTDGIRWTARTTGSDTTSITFGSLPNPTYITTNATAGTGGNVFTSTDAIVWTARTTGNTSTSLCALYSEATLNYYVISKASGVIQTSTDAIAWTLRTSGTIAALRQLLYGNLYIVSGDSGVLNTSTDTIVWTLRTSGTAQALYGLAYTSGTYIASGAAGTNLYSTDAITWRLRTSGFGANVIQTSTFGNNIFINGGVGATLAISTPTLLNSINFGAYFSLSTDSISWTLRTTNSNTETINSFAVDASNNIIAGYTDYDNFNRDLIASTDSITWQFRTSGFGNTTINTLLYANSLYVLGGNIRTDVQWTQRTTPFAANAIYTSMYDGTNYWIGGAAGFLATSTDSINWVLRTSGTIAQIGYATGGGGLTYASGQTYPYVYSGASGVLASSTNGIVWTLRTLAPATASYITNIFGLLPTPTYFSYLTAAPFLATSTDTIAWTLRTAGNDIGITQSGIYSDISTERYLGCRTSGVLQTSTNAIVWTTRNSGTAAALYQLLSANVYIVAGTGVLNTSTNAIVWTLRTLGTTQTIYGLAYTSGNYVASGTAGATLYSTDAITWLLRTSGFGTSVIQTVSYGNNIFINGGVGATLTTATPTSLPLQGQGLLTSTDSIAWSLRTSFFGLSAVRASLYGNVYVIAGDNANLASSTDGISWVLRTSGFGTSSINSLVYNNNVYVAAGTAGHVRTSTDAITWISRSSLTASAINTLGFGNDIYVYGGVSGAIATTTQTILSGYGVGAYFAVSTNAISWTLRTTTSLIQTINSFAIGPDHYVAGCTDAINTGGFIAASTDTINWVLRTSGLPNTAPVSSIIYGDTYVASGNYSQVTSPSLLLLGDGPNGSTTIVDSSSTNLSFTTAGTVTNSTDQYKYVTGSLYFANRTSTLTSAATSVTAFGTGDFTVEFWVRVVSPTWVYSNAAVFGIGTYAGVNSIHVIYDSSNNIILASYDNSGVSGSGTTPRGADGSFHHVAISRNAGTTRYFYDGNLIGSRSSDTGNFGNLPIYINRVSQYTDAGVDNGIYFDEVRIVKGVGVYTTSFTPPTSFTISPASQSIATSTDSITWVLRTSGTDTTISGFSYTNSLTEKYLNFGSNGAIQSSTDTITWILRTSGTAQNLTSAIYGSVYVLSGNAGTLNTSTDAITWTLRTSGFGANNINEVTYSNSVYVAAGASGIIFSSTDAINWIARTSNTTQNLLAGVGIGTTFISAGAAGAVTHSPLPLGFGAAGGGGGATATWEIDRSSITGSTFTINVGSGGTSNTAGAGTTISWSGPAGTYSITANGGSAGGVFAGGAGGTIPNANTNYLKASPGTAGGNAVITSAAAVVAGTNAFLSYQTTGGGGGKLSEGTFGLGAVGGTINYYNNTQAGVTNTTINGSNALTIPGLSYGGGGSGSGASAGPYSYWILRTTPFAANAIYTSMYDGTIYWIGGAAGFLASSTNSIVWSLRTSGTAVQIGYASGGSGLLYASGQTNQYVYAGASGVLATSTDGISWTLRTSASAAVAIQTLTFGALPTATYVWANATAGVLATSTNAIQWTLRTTGNITNIIQSLLYSTASNDRYLNVRASGAIQVSTDAIAWVSRTTGNTTAAVSQIIYGNVYIAAGGPGAATSYLSTSTDTIVWVIRTVPVTFNVNGLAYTLNSYIASGSAGTTLYSTDAIVWIARTSGFGANAIQTTTFGNGIFINGGVGATLSTATFGTVPTSGSGVRGGGGGGGSYDAVTNTSGPGGTGGDGYARISWV